MSVIYVTKKNDLPERSEHDFYPTPLGFCIATLRMLDCYPLTILDPGAGTGVWGRACRETWPKAHITGVELRDVPKPDAYNLWENEDFKRFASNKRRYDLIIGNPPFKDAEMFVNASLQMLSEGGYLVFLLRLAFLEGQDRAAGLWVNSPLYEVIVSAKRINFVGNSNPNSCAVFVWKQGYTGKPGIRWVIHEDNTPELAGFTPAESQYRQTSLFDICNLE